MDNKRLEEIADKIKDLLASGKFGTGAFAISKAFLELSAADKKGIKSNDIAEIRRIIEGRGKAEKKEEAEVFPKWKKEGMIRQSENFQKRHPQNYED